MTIDTPSAIAVTGARPLRAQRLPGLLTIVTDSRSIRAGETYLALRGERFDGHAFVADAFAKGAATCIVADAASVPEGRPALLVSDTLRAYLDLAHLARGRIRGPVVAITGSAGKTTTKAFLAQLLSAADVPAVATPENENNEIGVSKFFLRLDDDDARVAVVEMGARKYLDLDVLVDCALPNIGILTNIGEAHMEIFGTRERLAATKWGLFARGARAVLNLADEVSRARANTLPAPPLWFGVGEALPPIGAPAVVVRDATTLVVHDGTARVEHPIEVRVPGTHNRANLAAAIAAAIALGTSPSQLAPHVGELTLPAGRYESHALAHGGRLIFDAYNASLSGTLATLATFAQETAMRRIAVLGGMAELGDESAVMHERAGSAAARAADVVLAGGAFAEATARGAREAGLAADAVVCYGDNAAAVAWLRANLTAGDVVLLKGSRMYAMEEIRRALTPQTERSA
jgi:UDP-N-acetylmuramoyl-tripeptide--D-alanyl-D-alanine ligase